MRPGAAVTRLAVAVALLAAGCAAGWSWGGAWRGARDYQHFSASGR